MNKFRKDPDLAWRNEVVFKTILRMMWRYFISLYNDLIRSENQGRLWKWRDINGEDRNRYIQLFCERLFGDKTSRQHQAVMKYLVMKRMDFDDFVKSNQNFEDVIVPLHHCLYNYSHSWLKWTF